jgi:CubicO group peptidase (beta-lactamase class C family)
MKLTKLLILTGAMSVSAVFAQEITQNDPPEAAGFDVNNISYSFQRAVPELSNAYIGISPAERKDGISVGNLAVNRDSRDAIIALSQKIFEGEHGNYDALLISHKNKLVFESYYRKGRVNMPHYQASATKAYISLAIGRAIQMGYLTMNDLHKPITHILKDLDIDNLADGIENITLHQLLSMRSGIRVSADARASIVAGDASENTQKFLQHTAAISPETQTFKYQGIDPRIAWEVLDQVVPGSAENFVKKEILAKIGITVYAWDKHGEDSNITSRDMLKLGTLVLNEGKWNDEQLISVAYLANATSKMTKPTEDWIPDSYSYGYFWYQTDMTVADKSYNVKFAWGGGGQYIVTVDELDLMVTITGHDREDTILDQVSKTILPAFVEEESPAVEHRYLGQKPPGSVPELFAPSLINTDFREAEAAFSPDLKEFYFRRRGGENKKNTLVVIQFKDNQWTESVVPPRAGEPFISTDGKKLYLGNKYRDRSNTGWSEVKSLGAPIEDVPIMRLTASSEGTYYFDEATEIGNIRCARLIAGKREKPRSLNKEINSGKWTAHPFIAPDESYLIWDSERENGYGDSDLYISFRQDDGGWGAAINLGDQINSKFDDAYGSMSPDGKYFFFHRSYGGDTGDIYWVDAQIIESLRP